MDQTRGECGKRDQDNFGFSSFMSCWNCVLRRVEWAIELLFVCLTEESCVFLFGKENKCENISFLVFAYLSDYMQSELVKLHADFSRYLYITIRRHL